MSSSVVAPVSLKGVIVNVGYCVIAIRVTEYNAKVFTSPKVIYVHKFPPANSTTVPDMNTPSEPEECRQINLTRDEIISFWSSTEKFQVNDNFKGGEWGSANCLLNEMNCDIGDTITIMNIKEGIIPYKGATLFNETMTIIPGSETKAWSCLINIDKNINFTFNCYVCDQPMPQSAIDVLFFVRNPEGVLSVKILKRGSANPTVDCPETLMPGGGEHREPGRGVNFKAEILRTIGEELGISAEIVTNSYLLELGVFNEPGRDQRYAKFCTRKHNGEWVDFGFDRYSESQVFILFLDYYDTNNDTNNLMPSFEFAKLDQDPADKIEVGGKMWMNIDEALQIPAESFLIREHKRFLVDARECLAEFIQRPPEAKAEFARIL